MSIVEPTCPICGAVAQPVAYDPEYRKIKDVKPCDENEFYICFRRHNERFTMRQPEEREIDWNQVFDKK